MLAIKQLLDSSRAAGQLILTGSSNFLRTPALSESLAGRIDLLTLWPLSVGELSAGADGFADRAFSGVDHLLGHDGATPPRSEYLDLVCRGGYREVQRLSPRSRRRWFERYVETVLRREVGVESKRRHEGRAPTEDPRAWGSKVVGRLAADLRAEFPGMKSLSPRNLIYLASFARAWPELAIAPPR